MWNILNYFIFQVKHAQCFDVALMDDGCGAGQQGLPSLHLQIYSSTTRRDVNTPAASDNEATIAWQLAAIERDMTVPRYLKSFRTETSKFYVCTMLKLGRCPPS